MREILNDTERKVLLYIADRIDSADSNTLESTGLAENALVLGIVNAMGTWNGTLHRLRQRKLIESTRVGTSSLYALTEDGIEWVIEHRPNSVKSDDVLQKEMQRVIPTEAPTPKEIASTLTTKEGDKALNTARGTMQGGKFAGRSIEDQFRAVGITPQTVQQSYTAPQGIALPKQGTYTEDLQGVLQMYKDRINARPGDNEVDRLNEWYTKLSAEGRPAYHWIQEAICRVSTKVRTEQRTIAYMIGILKSWRDYGYGTDFGAEQKKLFDVFRNHFGHALSEDARTRFLELLDTYGIVEVMTAIFGTNADTFDPSGYFVAKLQENLNKD